MRNWIALSLIWWKLSISLWSPNINHLRNRNIQTNTQNTSTKFRRNKSDNSKKFTSMILTYLDIQKHHSNDLLIYLDQIGSFAVYQIKYYNTFWFPFCAFYSQSKTSDIRHWSFFSQCIAWNSLLLAVLFSKQHLYHDNIKGKFWCWADILYSYCDDNYWAKHCKWQLSPLILIEHSFQINGNWYLWRINHDTITVFRSTDCKDTNLEWWMRKHINS